MKMVKFGRVWKITSRKDYDEAMKILEENDFIAKMSDDYRCWREETDEINRQRWDIRQQAEALGIL